MQDTELPSDHAPLIFELVVNGQEDSETLRMRSTHLGDYSHCTRPVSSKNLCKQPINYENIERAAFTSALERVSLHEETEKILASPDTYIDSLASELYGSWWQRLISNKDPKAIWKATN